MYKFYKSGEDTMYKSFSEAKAAAESVIRKTYGGNRMDCVVTETILRDSNTPIYNFRFFGRDTAGRFETQADGSLVRATRI